MRMVVPGDPGIDSFATRMATRPIPSPRLDEYARGGFWVAEERAGSVTGAVAAPPVHWISSIPGVPRARGLLLSRAMMEGEYLAVDPRARGRRTGALLVEYARRQLTARGYRLMTATVTEDNFALLPYYRTMGWHTLAPGKPLGVLDPAGPRGMWRPSEPHVAQMWMPLRPAVATTLWPTPNGIRPIISGVLPPSR